MADNGDFVVLPVQFEKMLLEKQKLDQTEKQQEESLIRKMLKEPSLVPKFEIPRVEPVKQVKNTVNKRKSGDERFTRISKLALLFAKNGSYNEKFEIKHRDGGFVENSDVVKFFKFATQNRKRLDHLVHYVNELLKINTDYSILITNPNLLKYIEDEYKRRGSSMNQVDEDESKVMFPFTGDSNSNMVIAPPFNPKPAEPNKVEEKSLNLKRERISPEEMLDFSDLWTYQPPEKKGRSEDPDDEPEWYKIRSSENEATNSFAEFE